LAEAAGSNFDLDPAIDAEHGHRDVACEAAARTSGQWNSFGRKAGILEQAHKVALSAIAFLARAATAGHESSLAR
jgi:hypothetical protein